MTSGLKLSSCSSASSPLRANANLQIGLVGENAAEELAHQRGIVDDEDLDHALACCGLGLESIQQSPFGTREQLGGIEQQHDAARLLEVDHAAHQPRNVVGQTRAPVRRQSAGIRSTSETLSTIRPARCRSVLITTSRRPWGLSDLGMSKRRR